MFDLKKTSIIVLLLGAFCAFDVSAETAEDKKEKYKTIEVDPEKKSKTDSLANIREKPMLKDSVDNKANSQSSMSSMSYNILFQVIYRYSFKEIFDSPAASEIVSN